MIQRMSKSKLVKRIERSWNELQSLLSSLTPAQMTTPPAPGEWTVKDHLAHLTAWEAGTVAMLRRQPRFAAMGLERAFVEDSTEEQINQRIYELNHARSLDEVWEGLRRTHAAMLQTIAALSEEELYHTYSYFQPDDPGEDRGIPVIEWVKGNTFDHFDSHTEWIRKLSGG